MSLLKDAAYKALDTVTLGRGVSRVIGGQTVKFPARFSRYYEAGYEPETFDFFRRTLRPGNTVLDIGAHIGLFAVVAAKLVGEGGKVFSFEPTPFTRGVLQEVVRLNDVDQIVEVRAEAVSAKSGSTVFYDTGNEISNANSLVRTERSIAEIPIKLISVDEFAAERGLKVDCLKIDVEGAELDLLRGARETFMRQRPNARLGLHPPFIKQNGQSLGEIWDLLEEYSMEPRSLGQAVGKEHFCSQADLFDVDLVPLT